MHVICGYESNGGILRNYIWQFATFHLPTQCLHLSVNYHIYHSMMISFATMGDIILLGDFNARTKDDHSTMFDTNEAVYGEVMAKEVGLNPKP